MLAGWHFSRPAGGFLATGCKVKLASWKKKDKILLLKVKGGLEAWVTSGSNALYTATEGWTYICSVKVGSAILLRLLPTEDRRKCISNIALHCLWLGITCIMQTSSMALHAIFCLFFSGVLILRSFFQLLGQWSLIQRPSMMFTRMLRFPNDINYFRMAFKYLGRLRKIVFSPLGIGTPSIKKYGIIWEFFPNVANLESSAMALPQVIIGDQGKAELSE